MALALIVILETQRLPTHFRTCRRICRAQGIYKASIGCTLPGAWPRVLSSAERVSKIGVNVRVVKGMWSDPGHPDVDFCQGYIAVIERLGVKALHVGIDTHTHGWQARQ